MNWRTDSDYAFCDQLDAAGWAWQFLRREPDYRSDYAWFIDLWNQLETAYGAPPQRDFFKWKQDPRAWRDESEMADCNREICPGENNQVLIECWMGAKWGLRKFPIDPALNLPDELVWRDAPIQVVPFETSRNIDLQLPQNSLALIFDLSLPLPAQLEDAKKQIVAARHQCAITGNLPPRNVREGAPLWRLWLRLLDALDNETTLSTISEILALDNPERDTIAAKTMCRSGYRRILMLEP